MAIPYFIPGIIYLVGLACAGGFFLFNFYHLRRFGFFDFTALVVTTLTGIVVSIVIIFSVIFLIQIDWTDSGELLGDSSSTILDSF